MKKLMFILVLLSGTAYADDNAGSAFVTGFANALTRSMGGQPYTPPAQVQQVDVYTAPPVATYDPHVDAVTSDNHHAGLYFFNTSECLRFLHRSGFASGYTTCTDVY